VSLSKDEYAAMGVPFRERGKILSERLEVMKLVFEQSPATHHGHYFDFEDIYLEPKAFRPEGPRCVSSRRCTSTTKSEMESFCKDVMKRAEAMG
jgi:alkanesulfonate monooxygenase SsuD/methylene tetrahydromethanopterin reductase-like flavin-dependent oxidoreductase (luciferase family)